MCRLSIYFFAALRTPARISMAPAENIPAWQSDEITVSLGPEPNQPLSAANRSGNSAAATKNDKMSNRFNMMLLSL